MRGQIIIVDDDEAMCRTVVAGLVRRGFAAEAETSAAAALERVRHRDFDAVATDLNMRGMSGIDLCTQLQAIRPDLAVVVITAFGSLETAVQAIRAGAYDFITKPFDLDVLALTLDRAVAYRALRVELRRLRQEVGQAAPAGMVGDSPPMRRLIEIVARVAPTEANVLITGETGTGKELVARALHDQSARSAKPFVAVNCASIPEALLESELFGHLRGAFTDARGERLGLFRQAHGGTLFLDEIGDLSPALQPKLLRVLQERRVRPVGADQEVEVDVRLLAATHRDLAAAVEENRFRQDLLYRIDVVHLEVPPLRARSSDILKLAQDFLTTAARRDGRQVTGIGTAAAQKLMAYPWPGNVRELQNAIEGAVALTGFEQLTVDDLPAKVREYRAAHVLVASDDPTELVTLEEIERRYILRVLEVAGGNRTHAARILGLDRKTLYRRLQQYGMPQ